MRLFEHPDFEQAIIQAEQYFRDRGLRAAIIEKDYYVTEVLRSVAQAAPGRIIFKGGTSLSKGWNLIQRFSEDIDLFLDPQSFEPPLGKKAIDRELKLLRDAVGSHPALTLAESKTIGGFGRGDGFSYRQLFGGPGGIAARVLLEAGTASGREPTEVVALGSYLGEFLAATSRTLGAVDEGRFDMRLLHFRRTFVEKLFAIHAKVELMKRGGRPLGTYARHYYDLHALGSRIEVRAMLASAEYGTIKADYDRISSAHFARDYVVPEDMSFANSVALFPPPALDAALATAYERQCQILCFGAFPPWSAIRTQFDALRSLL